MKKLENLVFGLIIIAIGIIFGLNALEITNIDIFFDGWWTLIIIIPSFFGLFTDENKTGDLIGLVLGIILFLACQDFISFKMIWKLIVPAMIVFTGLMIIRYGVFGKKEKSNNNAKTKTYQRVEPSEEIMAVFSSKRVDMINQAFLGASLVAVFGGVDLDLQNAHIQDGAIINVSCIFGGVDIFVSDDVNIQIDSKSFFGSTDLKNHQNRPDKQKTIYINSLCLFGGVDIK